MGVLNGPVLYAVFVLYCALLTAAAVWDARKFIVPNQVSLGLIGLFFASAGFWSPPVLWLSHIGAGAVVLAVGLVLFSLGRLGGGDVKLMSAVSIWTGFEYLLDFLIAVSIAGGVLALVLILVRRGLRRYLPPSAPRVLSIGENIPYAVAIAPAGILVGAQLTGVGWPWP